MLTGTKDSSVGSSSDSELRYKLEKAEAEIKRLQKELYALQADRMRPTADPGTAASIMNDTILQAIMGRFDQLEARLEPTLEQKIII